MDFDCKLQTVGMDGFHYYNEELDKMNLRKEIQHIYLVGAKSLGAYGGYETFV